MSLNQLLLTIKTWQRPFCHRPIAPAACVLHAIKYRRDHAFMLNASSIYGNLTVPDSKSEPAVWLAKPDLLPTY